MGNPHHVCTIQSTRIKLDHKPAPPEGLVTSAQSSLPLRRGRASLPAGLEVPGPLFLLVIGW